MSIAMRPLSPTHQAADGAHQLVGLIGRLVRAAVALAQEAVARVAVQQAERDLVQRRLDGGDLGQDVDAVAVLVDHARDAADLTLDPGQALVELLFAGGVATRLGHAIQCTTTPEGYYTVIRSSSCRRKPAASSTLRSRRRVSRSWASTSVSQAATAAVSSMPVSPCSSGSS